MAQTPDCNTNLMGYLAWHAKARRLTNQGIRQRLCAGCGKWKFPDERCASFAPASRSVVRAVNAAMRDGGQHG